MTPHRYSLLLDEVAALAQIPREYLKPFELGDHPCPDRIRRTTTPRTQNAQKVVEIAIDWTLAAGNPFMMGRPSLMSRAERRAPEFANRMEKLRELQREVMQEIWA